ncbi:putative N6-adenine-specific DNA methylase [Desulfurobacterium pacificum]|uniref:N6-adenine-specific DNA methylase n=1 Tax=Desulfurobacterium pacificum TaxID=240166 RepID=A0ABY1NR53_9BACT|nr:class I SAM-dependent RNA methyltransferase [Desulfurobacterium pacificum]SMP15855.1 putative N6-adenine-specific DNA methylase [Desulfurobacterium pacificum]
MKLFAVAQPGLEKATYRELKELNIDGNLVPGGVEFEGDLREIYLTNLWLRTANRILLRLCSFRAKHFGELVRKAAKCNWENYITPELPIKVRVTSKKSKLYHTKAIEERILKAIAEKLGFQPKTAKYEDEGTSVIVRFENDICTISINTSGAMLHKRGYRVVETEAPIRENIAAAMIILSNWNKETPLIDPFCGSGTIPIEAALLAANIPPGINRTFAFMKWKNFDLTLWEEIKKEAESKRKEITIPILGFDIDPEAIKAAEENAEAAGVSKYIEFKQASFPPLPIEKATVITNPPYGERLKTHRTKLLYVHLGDWIRNNFSECEAYFITDKVNFAKSVSENVEGITNFSNGGIKVRLYRYRWKKE